MSQKDDILSRAKDSWTHYRTCSRVHGGPCSACKGSTRFGYWVAKAGPDGDGRLVLCEDCYDERYEPAKFAKEKADRAASVLATADVIADERARRKDGRPPREGHTRQENFLLGPLENTNIGPVRRLYEIEPTLYDTEAFVPGPSERTSLNVFKAFEKFRPAVQAYTDGMDNLLTCGKCLRTVFECKRDPDNCRFKSIGTEVKLSGDVPYRARDKRSTHKGATRTRDNVKRKPPRRI